MKFPPIKNFIQSALKINNRNLIIIFLVSFLFRLLLGLPNLINKEGAFTGDSIGYLRLAAAIKQSSFPSLFRTPVYPIFIAITTTDLLPNNIVFTLVLQMLLDSIVSLILIGIFRRIFDFESVSALAGLFYAISPIAAVSSSMLISESLHVFFTLSAIYILVLNNSVKTIIGQALFWGLASLTRPSALFFPLISYLLINTKKIKYSWKKQTLAIVLYTAIILGWCGFNYIRTGRFFFSTVQSVAVYKYELPAVQMLDEMSVFEYAKIWITDPRKGETIRDRNESDFFRQVFNYELSESQRWHSTEDAEVVDKLQNEAKVRLNGKYQSVAIIHFIGAFQILRPLPPWVSTWASIGISATIFDALRLLLFSISLILLLWKRTLPFWMFVSVAFWLVYTFFLPGVNGVWRFRVIAEPVICIIISLGIISLCGMRLFTDSLSNNLNKVKR